MQKTYIKTKSTRARGGRGGGRYKSTGTMIVRYHSPLAKDKTFDEGSVKKEVQ